MGNIIIIAILVNILVVVVASVIVVFVIILVLVINDMKLTWAAVKRGEKKLTNVSLGR